MPKKTLLITLLIVILTALLAAAAFYIKNKATQSQKESTISPSIEPEEIAPETTPTEPNEIDTSKWKTYKNKELGISFDYLTEWAWWKIIKREANPFYSLGPSLGTWINLLERNRLDSFENNLQNYCHEYIDFSFVDPDVLVNCNNIKIESGQEGILRDGIICSLGLPGGSPNCEFQRTFVVGTNNKEYPVLITGKRWGYKCFMERCYSRIPFLKYDNMVACMKTEYENCKRQSKTALKLFDQFIKKINIW